ncbi:MAG: prolipoprotein diacylglyceryl transferase [Gemmatimonadota bacterium]|nr:prolipoprotein diacylglyceryl transferase [Gemmatimonadota bacterium]
MSHIFASISQNPFTYNIGRFEFTGFGIAMLAAFIIAQIIAQHETWRRGYDPAPISDLTFAAVIGGILGGKIYYAILMGDLSALFSRAGLVFWGGLIGGIIAVLFVAWRKKLSLLRVADVGGIAVAAAYAVGRTGCWAVGDDYGRPWNGPWAVSFPNGAPPSTVENMSNLFHMQLPAGMNPLQVISVHPTQLYEVVLAFIMFLILWRLRDHAHAEGWLFGFYCVLAGTERFFMEIFRAKDDRFLGIFTTAQVVAVLFVVGGVVLMQLKRNVTARSPGIHAQPPVAA